MDAQHRAAAQGRGRRASAVLTAFVALVAARPAYAVPDLWVPTDVRTIQEAIDLVDVDGTVHVTLDYRLVDGRVAVTKAVHIEAEGDVALPAFDADSVPWSIFGGRLFGVSPVDGLGEGDGLAAIQQSGGSLTLDSVAIDVLDAAMGVYATDATVDASFVSMTGHLYAPAFWLERSEARLVGLSVSSSSGGAVIAYGGSVQVDGSTFTDNSGETAADLVAKDGATLEVQGSTFTRSSGSAGGSILAFASDLTIGDHTSFVDCVSSSYGGCVSVLGEAANLASVTLRDVTFDGAYASWGGGAVLLSYAESTMERVEVSASGTHRAPSNPGFGGAVFVDHGQLVWTRGAVTGGEAGFGGAVHVQEATFQATDVTFEDLSAISGGAISAAESALVLVNPTLRSAAAGQQGGGVVLDGGQLTWTGGSVEDAAARQGGTVFAINADTALFGVASARSYAITGSFVQVNGGTVLIEDALVTDPLGVSSGALQIDDTTQTTVRRGLWCHAATQGEGAAMTLSSRSGTHLIENAVVIGSVGPSGAVTVTMSGTGAATIRNNTFAGNRGTANELHLGGGAIDVRNTIFARGGGLSALADPGLTTGYNLWFETEPPVTEPASTDVLADPQFELWAAGLCQDANLTLRATSPALFAGDPTILNADGSRSHIGAFGGPGAPPVVDSDGDGFDDLVDCADADPAVHPDASEVWYDGTDQDCDGNDDDKDGDGVQVLADCDDDDPRVFPGAPEQEGDGVDQDCASVSWVAGGCATTGGGGATAGAVLATLLALGRRRAAR
jgi:hypothetical protein